MTMAVRVAINGFGRIGRLVLRAAAENKRSDIEVVGINDLGPVATNAHLLKYDSVHGRFPHAVTAGDDWMDAGGGKIKVTAERDPTKLPWKELNVDVALECTGIFTKREAAAKHLEAGAKRVIISAPAEGADFTLVMGVNDAELKAAYKVISNASCTTNCLAPVAYVLHQGIGIERGFMTTIHSYTGDQSTVDTLHKDLRRERDTSVEEINELMIKAAGSNRFKGIIGLNREPTVSCDFNHDPHSSTFDLTQTVVMGKRLARVLSWYDNEWGFSNRMVDAAVAFGRLG